MKFHVLFNGKDFDNWHPLNAGHEETRRRMTKSIKSACLMFSRFHHFCHVIFIPPTITKL